MKPISGKTRIFGILADPIGHVRTPQVMNAAFAAMGADAVHVPMHVHPQDLPAFVTALRSMQNLGGCNITIPHKEAILPLCDTLNDTARIAGAVNVIQRGADGRIHGFNYDGHGFVAGLKAAGHDPTGKRVLLVGAGGAGKAIAVQIAANGAAFLGITNRTLAKAEALADQINAHIGTAVAEGVANHAAGYGFVINATSLGMEVGDPLPFNPTELDSGALVAEIIMTPEITAVMAAAQARGNPTHPGLPMLTEQVKIFLELYGVALRK